jgi:hypothetical protein
VFFSVEELGRGRKRDVIRDFEPDRDVLDLRQVDSDATKRGNQRFDFIGDDPFTGDAGQARLKKGVLSGDVDGDGKADFHLAFSGVVAPPEDMLL